MFCKPWEKEDTTETERQHAFERKRVKEKRIKKKSGWKKKKEREREERSASV